MNEYRVMIGGVEHTLQLSDDEAKARGLAPVETKEAAAPKNKARAVKNTKG